MCQLRWRRGIVALWTLVALIGLAAPRVSHAEHRPLPPQAMPRPPPVQEPTGDPGHTGGGGG